MSECKPSARADVPHCCIVVERRYLAQAQPAGLLRALHEVGCPVRVLDPEAELLDLADARWLRGAGLVVARGRSTALLTRLAAAEAAGVPTLNTRAAIAGVVDKAHMAARLQAAGIPVPPTWIGNIAQLRRHVPASAFPLIVKPVFGDNARGIVVANTPADLAALAWTEPCAIAQRLLPSDGCDIKLYAIGAQVWAVRRPSPLAVATGASELLPVPPAWRELALACGALFGLQLFGVDCLATDDGLRVIEVNDFPNYSGVPQADSLLARYVALRVRGEDLHEDRHPDDGAFQDPEAVGHAGRGRHPGRLGRGRGPDLPGAGADRGLRHPGGA